MSSQPFHEGELAVQARTGEQTAARLNGRGIGARLPGAALPFIARQRLVVAASRDASGAPWATWITGAEGFAQADAALDALELGVDDAEGVLGRLPIADALAAGQPLGLLFIELATRRRLRVNGVVAEATADRLRLAVREAFANCPKYIQRRTPEPATEPMSRNAAVRTGAQLTDELIACIAAADTAFVASGHPDGRLDASHRGGAPGFVEVRDGRLWVPDYPGNSMYNTLGNLSVDSRAGLTFIDFVRRRQLALSGRAEIVFDATEGLERTGGTGRWWCLTPERWVDAPWNAPLGFRYVDASPFNPGGPRRGTPSGA